MSSSSRFFIAGQEQSEPCLSSLGYKAALSTGMQLTLKKTPGPWLLDKAAFRDTGQK